jgi:hypothetical protein
MYVPAYTVVHYKGSGVGTRKETQDVTKASAETRRRMKLESIRAMELFYRTHFVQLYPTWVNFLVLQGVKFLGFFRQL